MTIRLRHLVIPKIFESTAEKDCLFAPDSTLNEVISDDFTKYQSGKVTIAFGAMKTLDFGDVTTVKGYYIELQPASDTVALALATLNVNALGARAFLPPSALGKPAKSFHEGTTTSLEVANIDPALALELRYVVWGT